MHDAALVRRDLSRYSLSHLSDANLLGDLRTLVVQEQDATAVLLAHIGEVDARRLFVPAGYASMFSYCVDELHLSEDAAYRRIRAARAGRRFPVLLEAIAEGRLHLAAVSAIAPHLTAENVSELIEAATHRRKSEVEEMLAVRFPDAMVAPPPVVRALPAAGASGSELVPGRVGAGADESQLVLGRVEPLELGSERAETSPSPSPTATPSPAVERFLIQVTVDRATYDNLRKAQALLSHAVPGGDVAQVLSRALEMLVTRLQKRKVGAEGPRHRSSAKGSGCRPDNPSSDRPAKPWSSPARRRHIHAKIRRSVWDRDGGRCTFMSSSGHRCNERHFLEFDHVEPYARGGRATVDGLRLRCRAHNQYEADRSFGPEFMERKREEANARMKARAKAADDLHDVVSGLRGLGCRADEARRAAEYSQTQGATLEERMRAALGFLSRRTRLVRGAGSVTPEPTRQLPGSAPQPPS